MLTLKIFTTIGKIIITIGILLIAWMSFDFIILMFVKEISYKKYPIYDMTNIDLFVFRTCFLFILSFIVFLLNKFLFNRSSLLVNSVVSGNVFLLMKSIVYLVTFGIDLNNSFVLLDLAIVFTIGSMYPIIQNLLKKNAV